MDFPELLHHAYPCWTSISRSLFIHSPTLSTLWSVIIPMGLAVAELIRKACGN